MDWSGSERIGRVLGLEWQGKAWIGWVLGKDWTGSDRRGAARHGRVLGEKMSTTYTKTIKVEITQTQSELRLKVKEPLKLVPDDVITVFASYSRSLLMPEFSVFVERIGAPLDEERRNPLSDHNE